MHESTLEFNGFYFKIKISEFTTDPVYYSARKTKYGLFSLYSIIKGNCISDYPRFQIYIHSDFY